jgi:ubiquinone/menaquinone biosynthesis C-methylase UbiE
MTQQFATYYASGRNRALFRWVDIRKKAALRAVLGGRRDLRVLDLGCGAGAVSGAVFAASNRVFGVDADPALLKTAASRGLETREGGFEAIPFEARSFDMVVMIDALEHVDSRERTFAEIRRVLQAAGEFVTITPNYASPLWVVAERVGLRLSGRASSGHVSPWTGEALDYWLSRYFQSRSVRTLNCGMWLCGVALGLR